MADYKWGCIFFHNVYVYSKCRCSGCVYADYLPSFLLSVVDYIREREWVRSFPQELEWDFSLMNSSSKHFCQRLLEANSLCSWYMLQFFQIERTSILCFHLSSTSAVYFSGQQHPTCSMNPFITYIQGRNPHLHLSCKQEHQMHLNTIIRQQKHQEHEQMKACLLHLQHSGHNMGWMLI